MPLLSVADALSLIVREVSPLAVERVPLMEALGRTLAEDVVSSIDSPPFDKALMDGYAVRSADLAVDGGISLQVIEEVTAGRVPSRALEPGTATRIMTGAPIPEGCDAVVVIERTTFDEATQRMSTDMRLKPGSNVLRRAASVAVGQRVLPAGRVLRAQELGGLAELGVSQVPVRRRPRVAVLATGDELVPVEATPGPGQIRNSNETMLCGQIVQAGGIPVPLGVAKDERDELRAKIQQGLAADVLLLTGGVSAGKLDLVPSELEAAGVRQVFHKVEVKPGKPVWFGVRERGEEGQGTQGAPSRTLGANNCFVFGLPGNPVSSLVCFELFARTALRRLMGVEPAEPQPVRARLEQPHVARGDRPTYHPARLSWSETGPTVRTVRWHGSSDLCGTLEANAMALFPAGDADYASGSVVDVFLW
ncbi:MAG: molybdopterin molybdotransferase MoeA [Planctomycetaceae bacterium]|nr:molybdopterin molybdotransferase MoeA [Planctomycetaceae bacterium]